MEQQPKADISSVLNFCFSAFRRGLNWKICIMTFKKSIIKPRNYRHIYFGDLTVAEAFAIVNTITIKIARQYGIGNVIQAARRSGISTTFRNLALFGAGGNNVI